MQCTLCFYLCAFKTNTMFVCIRMHQFVYMYTYLYMNLCVVSICMGEDSLKWVHVNLSEGLITVDQIFLFLYIWNIPMIAYDRVLGRENLCMSTKWIGCIGKSVNCCKEYLHDEMYLCSLV